MNINNSNIIMYTTEDGSTKIEVTFEEDTVWLSLEQMTELFQRDKSTISRHIKNVLSEGELRQESTVAKFATVQMEGTRQVSRKTNCGNMLNTHFGCNAADVLNSLQLMQDFGVDLICVEDGIDSFKDSGKLMLSVPSAVAEIERENIRTLTMAGREQKAREGKWNGGFASYGYRIENGNLVIAEDEV